jgi:pyruvate ferredoxin oxidoreductase gamma subunit
MSAVFQIRLHGRGGQGVVTAAELLSVAAFLDGQESVAFPSFGSERMGAPVVSYCRIDAQRIRTREPIDQPDAVVVVDASLLHHVDVFAGIAKDGYVLVNSARSTSDLGIDDLHDVLPEKHVVTIPASEAARDFIGKPLPNICMLGALAALTGAVTIGSLATAVQERFVGSVADANVAAARHCFKHMTAVAHA